MTAKPTIFALSSGSGRSGIAVIRVSGSGAGLALDWFVASRPLPRHFSLRKIKSAAGDVLDQAVVVWLPGPKTITGEDMVELQVHGSAAVVSRLFNELSSFEDFRLAEPGEFSRRSFENGKLDLVEIEGLADLLAAETESQRKLAMRQYLGEASDIYEGWRLSVLECLAYAEAAIDFAEEQDVAEQSLSVLRPKISELMVVLENAVAKADRASSARRGLSVVIAGAPNAGKSSLVNALAEREVSIVAATAGTTRDVVSDVLVMGGVPVRIVDTAGLRADTLDAIEVEGMRRARAELDAADILVWLEAVDADARVIPPRQPDVLVRTKTDLDSIRLRDEGALAVSVRSGEGIPALRDVLAELIRVCLSHSEDGIMVRARHAKAVNKALTLLKSALSQDAAALELLAEDVRNAVLALASITGRVDVEDVLGQIFSEFCIGK